MNYILIDGSYYIFYRFFALLNWWRFSHKNEPLSNTPIENTEFKEKFISLFKSKLEEIPEKLKIDKPYTFIVAQDCPRAQIWRTLQYPDYKGTRIDYASQGQKNPGPWFKLVYETNLFMKAGCKCILKHNHLEADDCIALITKELLYNEMDNIYIITSDTDYLQLIQPRVHIYNLKYKTVNTEKNSFGCPKKDLLCKIIVGDKADNIPGLFKKCGRKTAQKYIENIPLFKQKLQETNKNDHYSFNRTMIDFDKIPEQLQQEFLETCSTQFIELSLE